MCCWFLLRVRILCVHCYCFGILIAHLWASAYPNGSLDIYVVRVILFVLHVCVYVWLSLVLLETASHCAYAQEEIYVCHTLVVCVSCHTCMLYTYRDVLASLPCQSLCAYMCPTYVLIHIHLCIHTRWRVFYIRACIHWRLVYVAASFSSCGMYTYPCVCVVYITYVYAWARENALIYTFLFRVIYIYIYSKSILQCPTYFGWFYFFLAFCVNPKLLCRRNKIGKLGKLRCAFGGKAARRLRCWWRGDKAFGWRGGVAGAVRASVLLAAFVLVSTCVCVYSLWVIWTLREYIYTCWCGMLHAWGEGDATCWILMVMVCSKDLGVLFLLHMRFGSSSVHMYRRSTCDGVRFYLHRQ